jgi:hypothetical protein
VAIELDHVIVSARNQGLSAKRLLKIRSEQLSRMHALIDWEIVDRGAQYRPRGDVTLVEAVELVTRAIALCRAQKLERLLVDLTGLSGISIPTLDDRFWMAQDWAQESKGMVVVAMVVPPEYIHPTGFGVTAAADAGLTSAVFTSKAAALDWLRAQS